jgi:hypothetical protein
MLENEVEDAKLVEEIACDRGIDDCILQLHQLSYFNLHSLIRFPSHRNTK